MGVRGVCVCVWWGGGGGGVATGLVRKKVVIAMEIIFIEL